MLAGIVAVLAIAATVAMMAHSGHPAPAANPLPATAANRAACAAVVGDGAIQGAQSLTDQPRGRISRILWYDLNDVVSMNRQGKLPALGAAIESLGLDCRKVNSGG